MKTLKSYLDSQSPGRISDTQEIEGLLAADWNELGGDEEGGMEGYKLLNRMENAFWKPPLLSFTIERYGGTVMGSARAELQHWEVDVEKGIATLERTGHRQLTPMAPKLSIKSIAAEISKAIIDGKEDERVRWQDDVVVVSAPDIFPAGSGYKRTIESRRQRLCEHIAKMLKDHGWQKIGWNRFKKDVTGETSQGA